MIRGHAIISRHIRRNLKGVSLEPHLNCQERSWTIDIFMNHMVICRRIFQSDKSNLQKRDLSSIHALEDSNAILVGN